MNQEIEPFNKDIFDNSLFIKNNEFVIFSSGEISYADNNYKNFEESVMYVQLQNNIYSIRLLRGYDKKLIVQLNLELKNNLVYFLDLNLLCKFKHLNNTKIQSSENIKSIIVFFLSFVLSKSKDMYFGYLDIETKNKFKNILNNLNL